MNESKSTLLEGSRIYLSGPMDFVGSRIIEKYLGWRSILTPILEALKISVLDPWNKPVIRGLDPENEYGKEGVNRSKAIYEHDFWTNPVTRARYTNDFWETVHIDLRLTDISDFMIAFVPTNIYSVGTVHEIITARGQKKPTLLVSPPITYDLFPELEGLTADQKNHLKHIGLKENPNGLPSQWYGYIVGGHYLFDGFGWENLSLFSENFYPELLKAIFTQAKNNKENEQWDKVKEWVDQYDPLQNLEGSVLDNVRFDPKEEELFYEIYNSDPKHRQEFFWYNKSYSPKRPVLYELFSIASGYIPPKIKLNSSIDAYGNKVFETAKVTDDSWLLLSLAGKSNHRNQNDN